MSDILPRLHYDGSEVDCVCSQCMEIRRAYCRHQDKYCGYAPVESFVMYPGLQLRFRREEQEQAEKQRVERERAAKEGAIKECDEDSHSKWTKTMALANSPKTQTFV
jgi:hypothetical protein